MEHERVESENMPWLNSAKIYLQTIITFFRTFKSSKHVQLRLVKNYIQLFIFNLQTKRENYLHKL